MPRFTQYLALLLFLTGPLHLYAQTNAIDRDVADLERAIDQAMLEGQIPSLTIAVVKGEEIVWTGAYGYANLWARTPAVPSTVYLIGSTFKAMSTAALLQQMEAGKFSLDDPVKRYAGPMQIRNESPDKPITFRHLLTHTSGLPAAFGPHSVWGETTPDDLLTYLQRALRAEAPPETEVVYSNMAYTLIAYIMERFTGKPFRQHIKNEIFAPLEMTSTAFVPTAEMTERLAIPYIINESSNRPIPAERLKADVWPAGIVYGTVLDQANWLLANLNDGVFEGRQIIGSETLDIMHTRQLDAFKGPIADLWGGEEAGYGLTWWTDTRDGERFFAHSGSVPGYTAFLQGNRDQRLGVAILTNGNRAHPHLIKLADQAMALFR